MKSPLPDRQNALRQTIHAQLLRMVIVMGAVGLAVMLGRHFVWQGLVANPWLNGMIIAAFAFGTVLAFQRVLRIRADAIAFEALQEAFNDSRRERTETLDDPYWRHYRALDPGIVFSRPKSLGHMFEVAYDELYRAKNLSISVSTMQNVVMGIEQKLADERNQLTYLAGLLIFLGLIGTFIGLMEMVGSVGGIIGSLGGTDAPSGDAMKRLLTNLQVPLTGMATGFSSSLFGLFGSLILGILSRFGSHGLNILKDEFSGWLAGMSHMGSGSRSEAGELARLIATNLADSGGGGGKGAGSAGGISDVGVVATMAQGFGRMNQGMDTVNNTLPDIVSLQASNQEMIRVMLGAVSKIAAETGEMREQMSMLVAAQAANAEYLQELINVQRKTETGLTSGFNGMAHIMEVTGQAYLDGLRRLTSENYETNARLAKLLDVKAAGDRITEIAVGIEGKVKNGFGGLATLLERTSMSIETSMQRMAQDHADLKEALREGGLGSSQVGLSKEFEDRLASGFSEVSRSFETVFAAYSTILNRAMMQSAIAAEDGAPAPVAMPGSAGVVLPEHERRQAQNAGPEYDHDALRQRLFVTALNRRIQTN
ncbi:hypothetical protein [Rhabdaerophilum sp. SD176]|uniref:hypothetical protein n=1 Tax=Rhabdaerophilum sp. SD176 TaxID=2983548 RepID=UPI0024E037C4|nr:hypothetical protein [Rhabdaerophilum sp. SD176]